MKTKRYLPCIALMCFMLMSIVGVTLIGCASFGQKYQMSRDYSILEKANGFSFGGVGISGGSSDATIAFKHIFNSDKAGDVFDKLLIEATYEGRLYALCAMFYLDHDKYMETIKAYEDTTTNIVIWDGCTQTEVPLCSIIKKNDGIIVRLRDNKQSIDEWMKDRGIGFGDTFDIDFYGGGIPVMLSEYINSSDSRIRDK